MAERLTYTITEAAAVLGVSTPTLRRALTDPAFAASIGAFQLTAGGHWRIPRPALETYLGMSQFTTTSST